MNDAFAPCRKAAVAAAVVILLLAQGGCSCEELFGFFGEPAPEVAKPFAGTVGGVSFSYPSNWRATPPATEVEEGLTSYTLELESAGSAYMMVHVMNVSAPIDDGLDTILEQGIQRMRQAVSDMSVGLMNSVGQASFERFERPMLGANRAGRRSVVQYTVLNEPLPYRLEVVGATLADKTVVVTYGIVQEDWAKAAPGFDLVLNSLREP